MNAEPLPVSLCLIARDEEEDLPEAIRSAGFASEVVVVVDSRTRDRTAEAARAAARPGQAVRIERREWAGHVAQKNAALALASNDWALALDADERVSPELAEEIRGLFAAGAPACAGYSCPRRTSYLGVWIRHGGWHPDRKLRLFRRGRGRWGGIDPHDRVILDGAEGRLRGAILHRGFRSIADHLQKMDLYTGIAAREMRARDLRLAPLRMLLHPPAKFLKMYLLRLGFLDGRAGMILAAMGSAYVFLKYARLWELRRLEYLARAYGAAPAVPDEIPGRD